MDDRELEAMAKANAAIKDLIEEERVRVIQWLAAKYMASYSAQRSPATTRLAPATEGTSEEAGASNGDDSEQFDSFAELLASSSSDTPVNRVLLAAYWVQVVEGADSFKTFELNKHLKGTGNLDDNITAKLRSLRGTKPAKVIQLAKTNTGAGKGHRTMKLTTHGISEARKLLGKVH